MGVTPMKEGAVLVVGGGIGGIQAALDLADGGFKVYLAEASTAVGGRMAQLDKTFPTNDCAMCTLAPRLVEVGRHPNVELITSAEVDSVEGEQGHMRARLRQRPRFVDIDACTACGECAKVCPVSLPDPYNESLSERRAIHKLYPQAIPGAYAIERKDPSPCRHGCPAHTNVHGYVALARQNRIQESLDVVRERIPLPGVLGRICHHPCESECRRAEVDSPLSIREIKRYVADHAVLRRPAWRDLEPVARPQKRVAVVGSGPAGLTCADDLAAMGYSVTILEAGEELGGMLRTGIPHYRLPRDVLDREIAHIVDAPEITVRTGVRVGGDVSLEGLRAEGHDVVFLAVGAQQSRRIPIEGAERDGVLWGIELLKAVNAGEVHELGARVAVVGGGNVAMDVARVARRLGAKVTVACLESRQEMPAHGWEVAEAEEEGCEILAGWGPVAVTGNVAVEGLSLRACRRVFDEEGRFSPVFDDETTRELVCDQVIVSVGQASNLDLLEGVEGARPERGLVAADPHTLQTGVAWLFAGGDAQGGAASAVEAIRDGHEAARSIDCFLRGVEIPKDREILPSGTDWRSIPKRMDKAARREVGLRPAAARAADFDELGPALSDEALLAEASRCLDCGGCCECRRCETVCEAKAIHHGMTERELELKVGAVVLAPGSAQDDAEQYGAFGYGRWDNVVTSAEFERLLSATGPTAGHVARPSDGVEPKRIAWIQCVGSRDARTGRTHCSAVCCMFAAKEALIAQEHTEGLETTIFYMDTRAHGKLYDAYVGRARERYNVRYVRSQISRVDQVPGSKNLRVRYLDAEGGLQTEEFELVVLSVGIHPSRRAQALATRLGVALHPTGFAATERFAPMHTTRPGVYVCGAFQGPKDISETVSQASAAAAVASAALADVRGLAVLDAPLPAERDVRDEEVRVGVFICRCGINIASVVDVPAVVDYARTLPGVTLATEALFTCSKDHTEHMIDLIREHRLNRIVVSSCSPRTHEPLFQSVIRQAGLNPYLFSMANIRDQCAWVHGTEPEAATQKAKELTRMAVANARLVLPITERTQAVTQRALVVGGGAAGLTAALRIADLGFEVDLVERSKSLGGNLRRLRYGLDGEEVGPRLDQLVDRVDRSPLIRVHLGTEVRQTGGVIGAFRSGLVPVEGGGAEIVVEHGVTLVATGAAPYVPTEHGYGEDPRVLTQTDLEQQVAGQPDALGDARSFVMLQCVGSRNEENHGCSRVCCSQAVKNALKLKWLRPDAQVYVLYRDMRTYGLMEHHYQRARKAGVIFFRYRPEAPPEVERGPGGVTVRFESPELGQAMALRADRLVLSVGIRPSAQERLRGVFKLPQSPDGFLAEAHMKLRPVDFASDGMFLAGLAHGPKPIDETIAQAEAAVGRAARILWRQELRLSGVVSEVDPDRCAACLTCLRACPYDVPKFDPSIRAMRIEPAACRGCGICTAVCPARAVQLAHFHDEQLLAVLHAAGHD